jgi:hypothetical protein
MSNSAETKVQQQVRQYASLARGWLGALLVWFCEIYDLLPPPAKRWRPLAERVAEIKAHITSELRRTARELRIVLIAGCGRYARMPAKRTLHKSFPNAARRGQRMSPRAFHFYRRVTAHVLRDLHRGSLRERAARLDAMFANLDQLCAAVAARLEAMWRCVTPNGLILTASADACADQCVRAGVCVDSS